MRQIVGAKIDNTVTNDPHIIRIAVECDQPLSWICRRQMEFMAGLDLGKHWDDMANGPTLFRIDVDGKAYPPEATH